MLLCKALKIRINMKTNFFQKVKAFFVGLEAKLRKILPVGIKVVNQLKTAVDSKTADVLTALIPGDLDDQLKNLLRFILPKVLKEMEELNEIAQELSDNTQLRMIIEKINSYPKIKRSGAYLAIASAINQELMENTVTFGKIIERTQQEYLKLHETTQAA